MLVALLSALAMLVTSGLQQSVNSVQHVSLVCGRATLLHQDGDGREGGGGSISQRQTARQGAVSASTCTLCVCPAPSPSSSSRRLVTRTLQRGTASLSAGMRGGWEPTDGLTGANKVSRVTRSSAVFYCTFPPYDISGQPSHRARVASSHLYAGCISKGIPS